MKVLYIAMALALSCVVPAHSMSMQELQNTSRFEMLVITEKQFSGIEYVSGGEQENIVDGEDRLIITGIRSRKYKNSSDTGLLSR